MGGGREKSAKTVETTTTVRTQTNGGMLFFTNMRMVFRSTREAFEFPYTQIKIVTPFAGGFVVEAKNQSHRLLTDELAMVLHIIDLVNKSQTSKEEPVEGPDYRTNGIKEERNRLNLSLPDGWYSYNEEFLQPRDSQLKNLENKIGECTSDDEKKAAIDAYNAYYEEYKSECAARGNYFRAYFEQNHKEYN